MLVVSVAYGLSPIDVSLMSYPDPPRLVPCVVGFPSPYIVHEASLATPFCLDVAIGGIIGQMGTGVVDTEGSLLEVRNFSEKTGRFITLDLATGECRGLVCR